MRGDRGKGAEIGARTQFRSKSIVEITSVTWLCVKSDFHLKVNFSITVSELLTGVRV